MYCANQEMPGLFAVKPAEHARFYQPHKQEFEVFWFRLCHLVHQGILSPLILYIYVICKKLKDTAECVSCLHQHQICSSVYNLTSVSKWTCIRHQTLESDVVLHGFSTWIARRVGVLYMLAQSRIQDSF